MSLEARIQLRSSLEEKQQFEEAAALENMFLSEFLRRAAHLYAQEIIEFHKKDIVLSKEDGIRFLAALENPPKSNKQLKKAIRKYRKNILTHHFAI
jgi:uncharacterized protein (DUF1778 family)